jgi:hypothetical protein
MKGAAAAALFVLVSVALLSCIGLVMANPPLKQPLQYEQFCENQKVSGTGAIDVSTSVIDKKIALEYYNVMAGDGDIELDQTHAYSQVANKLQRNVSAINDSRNSSLNLYENEKLTYNAKKGPLSGGKYLNSKAFYGGIGASVQETFSVNQMEKDQTTFFASTAQVKPPNPPKVSIPLECLCHTEDSCDQSCGQYSRIYPIVTYSEPSTTPASPDQEKQNAILQTAGLADQLDGGHRVGDLMGNDPAHTIGIDTKNSFNGTWGVDAKWHKIFYKDIKLHEMFTGTFEAEKMIKFHENPVPEVSEGNPCSGIDC